MTTDIEGIRINYDVKGTGNPILFLHGWGADIKLFYPIMEAVSESCQAIALDLPGFGGSSEPCTSWSVDDYVDFVIRFLDYIDAKPAAVIGHSFGGRIMIKALSKDLLPFCEKAIFIDAAGIKPKKTIKQRISLFSYKLCKRILSLPPVSKAFPEALEKLRKSRGSADYNNATPIMRQTLVKVVNEDLTELLPEIKVPSLLIWGTADTATPISDGEAFERLIPDAGLVRIEGAGHFSFLQAPELCIRVIRSFLNIN